MPHVRDEIEAGSETITAVIEDTVDELAFRHDYAPREREISICVGMLELLRRTGVPQ